MMDRVLICGDRNWASHQPADMFDETYKTTNIIERNLVHAFLTGLYNEHMVGFGVVHLDPFTIIEGVARGADGCAHWWAESSPLHSHNETHGYDTPIEFVHLPYPANWNLHHKAAGPIRNQQMLDEGKPNLVVAFHNDINNSKGTQHMVKIAKKAGIPTFVVASA